MPITMEKLQNLEQLYRKKMDSFNRYVFVWYTFYTNITYQWNFVSYIFITIINRTISWNAV